jgi:NTP pyrophosphatase (non-canonical NTP hydrolase)
MNNFPEDLVERLKSFRDARDWSRFHTTRSLAASVSIEAGELLELTRWMRDEEVEAALADEDFRDRLAGECADVFIYLLLLADGAGIDLVAAARAKVEANEDRYPVAKARGNARKWSDL